jgi:hypothetical protein
MLLGILFFVLGVNLGLDTGKKSETDRIYEQCMEDNNKLSVVDATALCKQLTRGE